MMRKNPNLGLVIINAYTKFAKSLSNSKLLSRNEIMTDGPDPWTE